MKGEDSVGQVMATCRLHGVLTLSESHASKLQSSCAVVDAFGVRSVSQTLT